MDKVARNLGAVYRFPINHTIRRVTVAEHCFQVARLCHWVGEELALDRKIVSDAMFYALYHDDSEVVTGDIPSPAKKVGVIKIDETKMPILAPTVRVEAKILVKLCDLVEALIFCTEEQMMGNRLIEEVAKDIKANLITCIHTDWQDWSTDVYGLIDRHIAGMFGGTFYVGNLNVRPR